MKYLILSKLLGIFFGIIGLSMVPSMAWSLAYKEATASMAFLYSIVICLVLGGLLFLLGRKSAERFYTREAMAFVGIAWLVTAALGALPFYFGGMLPSYIDAYFECMSGLTTTGASVLTDIEIQSKGLIFWRSFTHWLGGMGIIVLFIAIIPYLGAGGKQLFRYESPGPDHPSFLSRIRDMASVLWKIYLGMTIVQALLLILMGMSFYESLCHTFGTLATGGFSTRNASVAHFNNVAIDICIVFFMILAGANFTLYFRMIKGDRKALYKDVEWQAYIAIIVVATVAVAIDLMHSGVYDSVGKALRFGSFQVVSIMTTTGFITADFDLWPWFSKTVLIMLMFFGGCAGSTGGGLKVIRVVILIRVAWARILYSINPRIVRAIRIGKDSVSEEIQQTVLVFFFIWILIFASGTLVMTMAGMDLISALTAVATTLNNVGPGLGTVGPVLNFAAVPSAGKVLLSLFMVLGRLELFAVLVLFSSSLWRRY